VPNEVTLDQLAKQAAKTIYNDVLRQGATVIIREALEAATQALREQLEQQQRIIASLSKDSMTVERALNLAQMAQQEVAAQREQLDAFIPDSAHVNALPEPIRRYIHDLETQCDPAGLVRENTIARDTIRSLEQQLATAREALIAAREPLEVASAYVNANDITVGMRLHARNCVEALEPVRAALAPREESQG
jgi:hypothetical protein